MATASIPVKQVDDILECPICTEVYTDPRVLPCIHTYCLKCIETWSKDTHPGDEVACPLCRKEFTLPSNGPRDLPKNFFVGKLLQLKELSQTESRSTPCEVCSYDAGDDEAKCKPATMYCFNCEEKLCESCGSSHRKQKLSRSHKVVTLGEQLASEEIFTKIKLSFCDKHPDENLKIYCFDCKLVLCLMCCVTGHNSHKCSDINEVAEEFSSQVTSDIDKIATGVNKCQELLQHLTKEKDASVKQFQEAEHEICTKAEHLKQMIERHKLGLLKELSAIRQKRMKEIDSLNEEIERHSVSMESLKKYASEVMNKGTACDIARVAGSLHERTDELLKFDVIERSLDDLGHVDVSFTSSNLVTDDAKKTVGEITFLKKSKGNE